MKRIYWAVQASAFYCLTFGAALMPAAILDRLGAGVGILISSIISKRRAILHDNIDRALPFLEQHPLWASPSGNIEDLARETFENLGRSLMEVCRLYHDRGEEMVTSIELRGSTTRRQGAKGKG